MSTSNHPILEFPLITSPLVMMEKTIKWKPNNIELAPNCPRCASSNTKFCYYNNYSVSQPRYFCKACRRYWTKGGSLRNVPIGGGCRKSRRSRSERQDCPVPSLEYSSKNGSEIDGDIQIDDISAVFAKCANKNVEKYYESTDFASFEGEDGKYVMSDDQLAHHHSLNGDQDFVFQSFDGFEVEGILGSEIWSEETNLQSFGSEKLQEFEVFSSDDQIRMSENLVTDINWGSFDLSTNEKF